jgi:hypothetical protein
MSSRDASFPPLNLKAPYVVLFQSHALKVKDVPAQPFVWIQVAKITMGNSFLESLAGFL